jgi:NAD(P)-dependent dehydrogenase (short-subunit alcohol dehydrogenase family)
MRKMIIFGGSGGIGQKITSMFRNEYNVVSLSSSDVDVVDVVDVEKFFEENSDVSVVLNLSGVSYNCFVHKYSRYNIDSLDKQIDINIKGTMNILSSALPHMRSNGYGRIVLISSVLSEMPVVGASVYSGCKSFIDTITKSVSLENSNKGITCNSIQLGYFDAGLLYTIPDEIREGIKQSIPLKRWGNIEELYKVVKTLIDVEYITGTNIEINGGIRY